MWIDSEASRIETMDIEKQPLLGSSTTESVVLSYSAVGQTDEQLPTVVFYTESAETGTFNSNGPDRQPYLNDVEVNEESRKRFYR